MTDINLTFPEFNEGDTASGVQVTQDLTDITNVVNGAIDDSNIAPGGITGSTAIAANTILDAQIADANIRSRHVDWTSVNSGVRGWRTNGYAGANGNRLIRVEKQVTLANDTNEYVVAVNWSGGDSPDGNVTFLSAPTISGIEFLDATATHLIGSDNSPNISGAANAALKYAVPTDRTTTGCNIAYRFSTAPVAGDVILMFLVAGAA